MKYNFSEETKTWLGYHTKNSLYEILCEEREKISKLEEENKKLTEQLKTKDTINNLYKNTLELRDSDFSDLVYKNANLKKENAKLQEQLKNAIVPKHKKGDSVFIIVDNRVVKGIITHIYVDACSSEFITKESVQVCYDVAFGDGKIDCYCDVFATEAEAQKYLEERK